MRMRKSNFLFLVTTDVTRVCKNMDDFSFELPPTPPKGLRPATFHPPPPPPPNEFPDPGYLQEEISSLRTENSTLQEQIIKQEQDMQRLRLALANLTEEKNKYKKQLSEHQTRLHGYEGSGSPVNSKTSTPTKQPHSTNIESMLGDRPDDSKTMQPDSVSLDDISVQFREVSQSSQVQQDIQQQKSQDTERDVSESSVQQITDDDIAVVNSESPSKVSTLMVAPVSRLPPRSVTIHLENPKKEMKSTPIAPQPVISHHERPQIYMPKPQQRMPSVTPVRPLVPQRTMQDVRVSVPQSKAQPVQNHPSSGRLQDPQINRSQVTPRPHVQPPRLPAVQSRLPVLFTPRMPSLQTAKPLPQPVYSPEVEVPKLSPVTDQEKNPVIPKAKCPELGEKTFHSDGSCTYFMKLKDSSPRVDEAQKSLDINTKMSPEIPKTTETVSVGHQEQSSPINLEKHRQRMAKMINKSPGLPANYLAPVKRTFSEVEDNSQEIGNEIMQLFGQAPVTDFSILSFGGKGDMTDKENKKKKFDWMSSFDSLFNSPGPLGDDSIRMINQEGADSAMNLFDSFGSQGPIAAETNKSVTAEDADLAINFFASFGSEDNNPSEEVHFNFNFDGCF